MDRQYVSIYMRGLDPARADLVTGLLSSIGYDGFEDTGDGLKAFISLEAYDEGSLMDIARNLDLDWEKSMIREENWNAIWENSFQPVVIPGKVAVRASFHAPVQGVAQEIIITPKMSFGTGHHATTWLMMDMMFSLELSGKEVLDFGTGTGILAILAEKLGAGAVEAIDNDPWCIENARENVAMNGCEKIIVAAGSTLPAGKRYDVVLANINKTFLLEHARALAGSLKPGGFLLLSGLLVSDRNDIENAYLPLAGQPIVYSERNNWIGLTFSV